MTIYIVQLVLILISAIFLKPNKTEKRKNIFLFITFIILSFVACLRDFSVGYDTRQYVIAFRKAAELKFFNFSELRYEYGFTFLLWILNKVVNHWQILLIITSLFINYSVLKFISKNSKNAFLSVLIYFFMNFYFFYLTAMRQAIAIAIILLGYENLKKNKNIKFIIYVFIATLFHQSALLALLFLFVKKIKYNKYYITTLIFAYAAAFILGKDIFILATNFSSRLLAYADSKFFDENYFGALLQFLINFVFFVIGYYIISKRDKTMINDLSNPDNFLIGLLSIANMFLLLTIKVGIFNRFSPYFSIFIIIWIPNTFLKIKSGKKRLYAYIGLITILALYWLIIGIFRPEWYGAIPYKFFINI